MTLQWDDSLKSGIEEIDNQHRELFEIFNRIRAVDTTKDKKELKNLLKELGDFGFKHFLTEEAYMKYFNYEYYEYHKFLHDKLREEFKKVSTKLLAEENLIRILPTIVNFVEVWIQDHYKSADIKMAEFLREQQTKGS